MASSLQIISSSTLFTLFTFFFFLPRIESTTIICEDSFCGNNKLPVRFPFRLVNSSSQSRSCGYKGFDLSCNNQSQTILSLPNSGDFVVRGIDYVAQTISIADPNHCLPNRLLHNFTVSGSPFQFEKDLMNLTFFNCSSNDTLTAYDQFMFYPPISCLSNDNFVVFFALTDIYYTEGVSRPAPSCPVISTVGFPMSPPYRLTWDMPKCGDCEARGGDCALKSGSDTQVGCLNVPSNGLPRSAKYGITIGVGIPGLLCIIGLSCFVCGRVRAYSQRRRQPNIELSSLAAPQRNFVIMGLDGPTIESYPKTLLGESRRLPKPSDNICPICLCEYQPKETLRTVPECNHYFHAKCIDEWLKLNGTCPVCRNSPDGSAVVTPSSLSSPSSSSSSSSLMST